MLPAGVLCSGLSTTTLLSEEPKLPPLLLSILKQGSQSQADEEEEEDDDFGVEYLLARDEEQSEADGGSGPPTPGPTTTLGPKKEITDIAAAAESLQPKGYTLATTQVYPGPSFCFLKSSLSCFSVTDASVPLRYLSSSLPGEDTHPLAPAGPAPRVPTHWAGLAGYYV